MKQAPEGALPNPATTLFQIHAVCKICGSNRILPWVVHEELMQCSACGLIFASRIFGTAELREAYRQLYSENGGYRSKLVVRKMLRKGKTPRMGWNKRVILRRIQEMGIRSVLELGAGVGDMAKYFADRRVAYLGVEFEESIADDAATMGFNVVAGDHTAICDLVPPQSVDAVVAFEVLEHIQDIRSCLETLRSVLKPHGVLAFSVPNSDVFRNWHPPRLGQTGPPIHLNFWDRHSLGRTLHTVGFSLQFLRERRFPVLTGNPGKDLMAALRMVGRTYHGPTLAGMASAI